MLRDLQILVTDTGRVWWRLLPQISGLWLLGWLGSELALRAAGILGDQSAWLALTVFAFSFLCELVAIVLILRLVGRELGIRELIPREEAARDDRDASVTRLLAVTLLPFLGLYAAFGQVAGAATRLQNEQLIRYGLLSDAETVLGVLNDAATEHVGRLLALVVSLYVLRRVLDGLHERTGWGLLGLLVALVESFFLLLVIMGGIRVWQRALDWVDYRAFWQWFDPLTAAVARLFAFFRIDLPAVLEQVALLVRDEVWPVFWEVVSEPIIWLAVAALVYGSQVSSLAELWRRSRPMASRVPGAARLTQRRERIRARAAVTAVPGARRVAGEVREAFLGDLDAKYLPAFHSLRLVLRAGASFLGAFVLAYAVIAIVANYAEIVVRQVVGGHHIEFWVVWLPIVDLVLDGPFEPLRLCLLAVAFRRCLTLFRERAAAQPAQVPQVPVGVPG